MKSLLTLFCLTLCFTVFSQGKVDGFYRGASNATVVLGYGYEDSQNYFIGTEKSDLNRTLTYINLFAAYGITDQLDIQVSLPYLESNENKSLQDLSVFTKYKIYSHQSQKGRLDLTTALSFSTPISDYSIGGLYDLGQQATVLDLKALVHYFFKTKWFITAQSGYSIKFEEVPNSIPFVLKLGRALNNYYYDVYYDYQYAIGGIDYRGTPAPQNFRELGVSYHKIGGTFYYKVCNNLGAYLTYAYVLDGRNTFNGPSYGIGLAKSL